MIELTTTARILLAAGMLGIAMGLIWHMRKKIKEEDEARMKASALSFDECMKLVGYTMGEEKVVYSSKGKGES